MNRYEVSNVAIIGIGGSGAYYIAKYLLLCGVGVLGYDLNSSNRTTELEDLGAEIHYKNPDKKFNDIDYYIYTHNLPNDFLEQFKKINSDIDGYEVGEMYKNIINDYEDDILSEKQQEAFLDSNIAPLYSIDFKETRLIGITGTDGKTTSCSMIYHILKKCGHRPSLISTVSAIIDDKEIDTGFHTTTPTSQELYTLFTKALDSKCSHIIVETTSHALAQGRIAGIKFDCIGYTNVTNEHLDYHKTYENYLKSKSLLITEHSKPSSVILLNMDDESYDYLDSLSLGRSIQYSVNNKEANLYVSNIESNDKLSFKLHTDAESTNISIPIYGEYNISNFLLACGISMVEDLDIIDIANAIATFDGVKGRMQLIQDVPFRFFVDFAHTPNAISKALKSVKQITKGKIIHIFGCAGLRDSSKRYEMGKISNRLADVTILTAEDPRTEQLKDINDEIERGWRDGGNDGELFRFDNDDENIKVRLDAIKKGIQLASPGDTVIISGKAHEQSLCFGDTEYPWNDIVESKRLLNS